MANVRAYIDQISEGFSGLSSMVASEQDPGTHFGVCRALADLLSDIKFSTGRIAGALEDARQVHPAWVLTWRHLEGSLADHLEDAEETEGERPLVFVSSRAPQELLERLQAMHSWQDANELHDRLTSMHQMVEDARDMFRRVAQQQEETGIHPRYPESLHEAAGQLGASAEELKGKLSGGIVSLERQNRRGPP